MREPSSSPCGYLAHGFTVAIHRFRRFAVQRGRRPLCLRALRAGEQNGFLKGRAMEGDLLENPLGTLAGTKEVLLQ